MARPKTYDDQPLTKAVYVRLTKEQHAALSQEAAEAGMPITTYIRNLALRRRVRTVKRVVLDADQIQPAVYQLARIGGNLNQIAHWLNCHRSMDD